MRKYWPIKDCEVCGSEYSPRAKNQKYCSSKCRKERVGYKRMDSMKTRKCERCDNSYVPNTRNQRWCFRKTCREYAKEVGLHRARVRNHDNRGGGEITTDGWTLEDWEICLSDCDNKCINCGATGDLTLDHWIPVSKGGKLETSNVVPLCLYCNTSKKDAAPLDWLIGQPNGLVRYVKATECIDKRKFDDEKRLKNTV